MNENHEEDLPTKLILKAFEKLNQGYAMHESVMCELLHMGFSPRAEADLQKTPPVPILPIIQRANFWKSCSLNTAIKEIEKIEVAINKLLNEYASIHATTYLSLFNCGLDTQNIEAQLNNSLESVTKAKKDLGASKEKHPEWAIQRTGRPRKVVPLHIAKILADEYWKATSKPPTVSNREVEINRNQQGNKAYGEFLELVESVFIALKVKASAEAMAREAEDFWKKRKAVHDSIGKK